MTLTPRDPQRAYARVEFEARVVGASPGELVVLCYEQLVAALGAALHAHRSDEARARSHALTRALTALTALELGIEGDAPVVAALRTYYAASRKTLLESVPAFDQEQIGALRSDFREIMLAMGG